MTEPGYPDRIIQTTGQPGVAIFPGLGISYAITWEVFILWSNKRTLEHVSAEEFGSLLTQNPVVADIAAGRGISGFMAPGEPGCLVIPYRDRTLHRHFINDAAWFTAVGIPSATPITSDALRALAPTRGTDLVLTPIQPKPHKEYRCTQTWQTGPDGNRYLVTTCSWQDVP